MSPKESPARRAHRPWSRIGAVLAAIAVFPAAVLLISGCSSAMPGTAPAPPVTGTGVTLRHLLTRTGGFEERFADVFLPWGEEPDLRAYAAAGPPEQVHEPGTVPAYSNYGYAPAGYVVERVSGQPFEDYVQEHVFDPLGLDSSTFHQPLPDAPSFGEYGLSRAHADDDSRPEAFEIIGIAPRRIPDLLGPRHGPVHARPPGGDRPGLGETDPDAALLDPDTLDLMHSSALDVDAPGTHGAGGPVRPGGLAFDPDGRCGGPARGRPRPAVPGRLCPEHSSG